MANANQTVRANRMPDFMMRLPHTASDRPLPRSAIADGRDMMTSARDGSRETLRPFNIGCDFRYRLFATLWRGPRPPA